MLVIIVNLWDSCCVVGYNSISFFNCSSPEMTALVVPDELLNAGNYTRASLRTSLQVIKREADAAAAEGETVYSPPPNLARFKGRRSHSFARRGECLDLALRTHAEGKIVG